MLLYVNFNTYSQTGLYGLALQGLYAFPVLPALYLIGNENIFRLLNKDRIKLIYTVFVIAVFLTAGLLSYLVLTNSSWHLEQMRGINAYIKQLLTGS